MVKGKDAVEKGEVIGTMVRFRKRLLSAQGCGVLVPLLAVGSEDCLPWEEIQP